MKLFLVGGFLGSGKTTAIVNACQHLIKKDQRVAVITNDQGDQQVDSAFVKSFGIPAAEVANGCFCCNYDQLDKHIHSFIKDIQPDIIFAESVVPALILLQLLPNLLFVKCRAVQLLFLYLQMQHYFCPCLREE
jgi:Ni2+-binding GTPase involved in maturation of urease and hydrogenase